MLVHFKVQTGGTVWTQHENVTLLIPEKTPDCPWDLNPIVVISGVDRFYLTDMQEGLMLLKQLTEIQDRLSDHIPEM